ncbi:hypothetical protein [Ochrobactrum sp. RH2CCR150]|uniref:hypothetical protein n=1 Tax=Ochrobactrum sp. RH2CCR150 TaxID=2587044 RepID=UPI0015F9EA20|nr:hypothetical protein [Ochrobactrum sp. RH2CCR150]
MTDSIQSLNAYFSVTSGVVTAIATIALAFLTWILARATNAMAKATSTANVVASLETNQWSWRHLDLIVHNTGNAPAFDVKVEFDPPLPYMTATEADDVPFGRISIIRPGQILSSNVNDFQAVREKIYQVTIQWKRLPNSKHIESNVYYINIAGLGSISRLGAGSPEVQMAEQIKKIREDWQAIASGHRRLVVDQYSGNDRKQEREARAETLREFRESQMASRVEQPNIPET